jgi:hypothetical protein
MLGTPVCVLLERRPLSLVWGVRLGIAAAGRVVVAQQGIGQEKAAAGPMLVGAMDAGESVVGMAAVTGRRLLGF